MAATTSSVRTKDGIPTWDGAAASFEEYSEQCTIYEQSTPYHKRCLLGPRLLGELTGAAKRWVAGQPATWLSYDQGVTTLLQHLRTCLGRPQIPELTEHLNRYFRQGRRRQHESMNEYISRKCEVYLRACQAMKRVAPHHQGAAQEGGKLGVSSTIREGSQWSNYGSWPNMSRRSSWDSTGGRDDGENEEQDPVQSTGPTATTSTTATPRASEAPRDAEWNWAPSYWWQNDYWSWSGHWQSGYGQGYSYWQNRVTTPKPETLPELLPEFVQAWYLLQDAGLSSAEKNLILTAIQNNFTVLKVAQELRTQFPDIENRRGDAAGRHSSYLGEGFEEEEETMEVDGGFSVEELDEEGQILWAESEAEIHQAWAAYQTARRTLREARAKQSAVKLSRKYFQPKSGASQPPKGGTSYKPNDEHMICMRCGKKGHRAANCREEPANTPRSSSGPTQSAPFICYTDQALSASQHRDTEAKSTREAVTEGFAVIDGGATRTLGSVEAIQKVMDINAQKYGSPRVHSVCLKNRPTFGFGNSTEDRCASTVELGITAGSREGKLVVHALDKGDTPILLSVATLRALGAVIDFQHDLLCFRAIDAQQVLSLERSSTGHQLLPLTGNLYEKARATKQPVPSLKDFVQEASE